jgi:Xaa-Pro aminopeptidase
VTTRGYWADTCRTFVVGGSPTAAQQEVHSTLKRALEAGVEMLKPGIKASDVYRAVYQVIASHGWGQKFPHHAGHAVGLDAWERPFIIPGCDDKLEEGMVIALEPGVYLEGVGAMRIENNYLVSKEGGQSLSHYPLDL